MESPETVSQFAEGVFKYGPAGAGVFLLLFSISIFKVYKEARDGSQKKVAIYACAFLFVVASSFLAFGSYIFFKEKELAWRCIPSDMRLKRAHKLVQINPDSINTFVTFLKNTAGDRRDYRVIAAKKEEPLRFVLTNREDYFLPGEELRGNEVRARSETNYSTFVIWPELFTSPCKQSHFTYNEAKDVIQYKVGNAVQTIEPEERSETGFTESNHMDEAAAGAPNLDLLPALLRSAFAEEVAFSLQTILDAYDGFKAPERRLIIEELATRFPELRAEFTENLARKDLNAEQRFLLVAAIRRHLNNSLALDADGRLTIDDDSDLLGLEIERNLLELTMVGDRATRLNARASLRTKPSSGLVYEINQRYAELDQNSKKSTKDFDVSSESAKVSFLMAGLDVLYNYAINTVEDARSSSADTPEKNRMQGFEDGFAAMNDAWELRNKAPVDYQIDFVKALYGKAVLWTYVAEQMLTSRLPASLMLEGQSVTSASDALAKVVEVLDQFEANSPQESRKYYVQKYHFERSKTCPRQPSGTPAERLATLAACFEIELKRM